MIRRARALALRALTSPRRVGTLPTLTGTCWTHSAARVRPQQRRGRAGRRQRRAPPSDECLAASSSGCKRLSRCRRCRKRWMRHLQRRSRLSCCTEFYACRAPAHPWAPYTRCAGGSASWCCGLRSPMRQRAARRRIRWAARRAPPVRRAPPAHFSIGRAPLQGKAPPPPRAPSSPRYRPARHRGPCCCPVESGCPHGSRRSRPCWRRSGRRSTAYRSSAAAQCALS
mmetsp:Transcript_17597/g.41795  ORF Transcript_17597/g.41795 Transcript_17597/m.41795 type:complete len:227 (-) Transcript_17597:360-1040(-)